MINTDVEGAARTWLRAQNLPGVGEHVYFGIPKDNVPYPMITVARIGGGPQPGEVPLEDPRLTFEVWARTKEIAQEVTQALGTAFWNAQSVELDANVFLHGATIDSTIWVPDPTTRLPRYVVDVTLTVMAIV